MAVQRRSVFPPLLKTYAEDAGAVQSPSREPEAGLVSAAASGGKRNPENNRSGANVGGQAPPGSLQRKRDRQPAKRSVLRDSREAELRMKRAEKADTLVKEWDAVLAKEKEDKHSELLKRLELQHKLIAKSDLLAQKLRNKEEEKQAKRIISQRTARRQMIQEVRTHNERVKEHKKKVAEKLQNVRTSPVSRPTSHAYPLPEEFVGSFAEEEEREDMIPVPVHRYTAQPEKTRLRQLLDFDPITGATPTIDTAWNVLKDDTERRMLPLVVNSYNLRRIANPAEKQLLYFYDQPVAEDVRSGQPIPLSHVLEKEAERNIIGTQSKITSVIHTRTKRNEMRAETLLRRKQAQVDVPRKEPTEYVPSDGYEYNEKLKSRSSEKQVQVKHLRTNSHVKKRLPTYLAPDGNLVACSLEEVGERTYCRPTEKRQSEAKPVFATGSESTGAVIIDKPLSRPHGGRWQPLSCTAAAEYEGTSVVPVKGLGPLGHGRYAMWKPMASYT